MQCPIFSFILTKWYVNIEDAVIPVFLDNCFILTMWIQN
ncbi:hypothetical protein QU9_0958 [Clostridioides difficile P48]|nr:hypothetical protein QU9_0958 [Clostridioides difficile P48]